MDDHSLSQPAPHAGTPQACVGDTRVGGRGTAAEWVPLAPVTWVYRCHFSSRSRKKGSTLENDHPQSANITHFHRNRKMTYKSNDGTYIMVNLLNAVGFAANWCEVLVVSGEQNRSVRRRAELEVCQNQ